MDPRMVNRNLRESQIFETLKTSMGLKDFNLYLDKKIEVVNFDIVSLNLTPDQAPLRKPIRASGAHAI